MREIKFRTWFKNKMLLPFEMQSMGGCSYPNIYIHNMEENDELPLIYRFGKESIIVLMQYTGLKDKNGKEVYEGDIICALVGAELFIGACEYIEKAGAFAITNEDELAFCNEYFDSQLEVIGNIYENSELLK